MKRKKIALLLAAALAMSALTACKDMPLEGVTLGGKAPGVVKDGIVSREDPIRLEIDVPASLPVVLPVEGASVSAVGVTNAGEAAWDAETNILSVTFQSADGGEVSLTFSADGYKETTCTWPVEVALHTMELTLTPAPSEEGDEAEPLEQETQLLLAEGDGPSVLTVKAGAPGALLAPDASHCAGVAGAALEGDALTITPLAAGSGKITVTASADKYEDAAFTFAVEVMPLSDISADKARLTLASGASASVTLSSRTPGVVFEAEVAGDAAAALEGNILTVTAGKEASSVLVRALAPGYAAGELIIPVAVQAAPAAPPSGGSLKVSAADTSAYDGVISEIIRLTNEERAAQGLSPLSHVGVVDTPAMLRAEEADTLWSHTRPDGSGFNTIFAQVGLSYPGVGENLFSANAFLSAREVVDAWMASPDHRRNILDGRFTGIGIGVYEGSEYTYWCQLFVMQ